MSTELKLCPFCGSNAKLNRFEYCSYVECKTCGACGPESEDENEAERKWNERFCDCEKDVKHKIIHECESLRELLISKNSNYGNSALTSPPFASVTTREALMVRLGDKFNRLQTLSKGEPDKVGESINDTIRDIAGYCILILIESETK